MQTSSRFKALVEQIAPQVQHIQPEVLLSRLNDPNLVIIDVREKEEFDKGHLPSAIHVSKGVLEVQIERVIPNIQQEIILYCGGGSRSSLAAYNLQLMGYTNVKSLIGGAKNWLTSSYPWES